VATDVALALGCREGAGLGLAVELLQLDAEGAEEQERLVAHGLAAGEGALRP
jgi:hypothetical protein